MKGKMTMGGFLLISLLLFFSSRSQQVTTFNGTVRDSATNDPLQSVTVRIKGTGIARITGINGEFSLGTSLAFPLFLEFSMVGFKEKEIEINSADAINVLLAREFIPLPDILVEGPNRKKEKIINSSVSIEIDTKQDFINSPSDPYTRILSKKGPDVTISSFTYRTYSTRGFNGSGSSRVNQLMDGMDNQAPGLNFSVGNFVGVTDLDIESIEILPGASSALYGPGGVNGTFLIYSKSPFKHPGFSLQIKNGLTDISKHQRNNAGVFYDYSFRWAKNFNDKIAFKLGAQYTKANDWLANDSSNYLRSGTSGKVISGTRQTDPNYDGVNVYGDETSVDVRQFVGAINPTPVSRTGYHEIDVIDPETKNIRLNGALHYKINKKLEAIIAGHWGTGNTVYTGNNRYALKDIKVGQYKVELKNKNWFLRGFTTQEDAGQAYSATVTTQLFNEAWKPSQQWYPEYVGAFLGALGQGATTAQAHSIARSFADMGRPVAGSSQFKQIFDSVRSVPIPAGGLFLETSQLWMGEGQYNFSEKIKFVELIAGGNYKKYILDSKGTLFYEPDGPIKINEWGTYAQATKKLFKEKLTLSASGRYDKNENFNGKFTPRFTALIKVDGGHNFRFSYQTAYKFPTTQQQWIHLDVGNAFLLGGLPWINDVLEPEKHPTFIYDNGQLSPWSYKKLKPESMQSFEAGYKNSIRQKLLVDAYVYFGSYTDFLGRIVLVQPTRSAAKPWSIVVNSDTKINTWGAGLGFDYKMAKNFFSFFNVYTDNLTNVPFGFMAGFNTPKYRLNAGFGNSGLGKKQRTGFSINLRWQDDLFWEGGGLADGNVKSYTTLDAQANYKLPKIKSMIKLGGTNITNKFYQTGFGNPYIGGMYYVSFAYNVL